MSDSTKNEDVSSPPSKQEAKVNTNDPVDEDSLRLFPERRGEVQEPNIFQRLVLGHRGVKGQKFICEKKVMSVVENGKCSFDCWI